MCHTRKTQAVTNHVGLKPNGEGHEGQQLQKKDSCSITGSGVQKKSVCPSVLRNESATRQLCKHNCLHFLYAVFYSVHCTWDELSCLTLMARNIFIQNARKKLNDTFHWATDANGAERIPDLTESPELWLSLTVGHLDQQPAVKAGFLKWCMKEESAVN